MKLRTGKSWFNIQDNMSNSRSVCTILSADGGFDGPWIKRAIRTLFQHQDTENRECLWKVHHVAGGLSQRLRRQKTHCDWWTGMSWNRSAWYLTPPKWTPEVLTLFYQGLWSGLHSELPHRQLNLMCSFLRFFLTFYCKKFMLRDASGWFRRCMIAPHVDWHSFPVHKTRTRTQLTPREGNECPFNPHFFPWRGTQKVVQQQRPQSRFEKKLHPRTILLDSCRVTGDCPSTHDRIEFLSWSRNISNCCDLELGIQHWSIRASYSYICPKLTIISTTFCCMKKLGCTDGEIDESCTCKPLFSGDTTGIVRPDDANPFRLLAEVIEWFTRPREPIWSTRALCLHEKSR